MIVYFVIMFPKLLFQPFALKSVLLLTDPRAFLYLRNHVLKYSIEEVSIISLANLVFERYLLS